MQRLFHAKCTLVWQNIALFNGTDTIETTLFCTFWFYLIPKSVFEVFIADVFVVLHNWYTRNACFDIYKNYKNILNIYKNIQRHITIR